MCQRFLKGFEFRSLTTLLGVIVLLLCFCLFSERSRLVPPGTRIDLGGVSVGLTKEKQLSIFNGSSKPIEILRWTPSCHCMQARFSQTMIGPHETISAFFKTTGMRPLGQRAAIVAVQWRYAGEPFVRTDEVVVSARYISSVSVSEERLDFGTVQAMDAPVKAVDVRLGNTGSTWNGLKLDYDAESLSVHAVKTDTGFQLQSSLRPGALPPGIWKSTIRIFPTLNGTPTGEEASLPVLAKIQGPFTVSPSVIQFAGQAERQLTFSLKIHSKAGRISELKFLGGLVQDPKVTILKDGADAIMDGILPAPTGKGAFLGKIPIQINNDPANVVQVSYIGFCG